MRLSSLVKTVLAAAALAIPSLAPAQELRPSLVDSFRLGDASGLLCRVQSRVVDPSLAGMFDRAYAIVCRDAVSSVGSVYALRTDAADPAPRLDARRATEVRCEGAANEVQIADLGAVRQQDCLLATAQVAYRVYSQTRGDTLYVAEGLTGYDSALQLALRTIVVDRILPGELAIATTLMGDASAFARVQAGTLDRDQALTEGYRRNNSGAYAEASAFFATLLLLNAEEAGVEAEQRAGEYLINQALQQSNLGQFDEADALYAQARSIPSSNVVQLRLRRNFQALHLLNQRRFDEALTILDQPLSSVATIGGTTMTGAEIDDVTARAINSADSFSRSLGGEESERLTDAERQAILDAQSRQLRGTILRLQGEPERATAELTGAIDAVLAVREGRVRSTARLRAQALGELALIAERAGDTGTAEARLREAATLVSAQYPASAAETAARARLAGFLARNGQTQAALDLFAEVVRANAVSPIGQAGLDNLLLPYFDLLIAQMPANPALVTDFFRASEILIRPGVADTQAVLARELSSGDDEASRLFRQSVTLTRAAESARIALVRLQAAENRDATNAAQAAQLEVELAALTAEQTATQARLADYPRFLAVSTQALELAELQSALRPGEGYLKLAEVGDSMFAMLITPDSARAWRVGVDALELDVDVTAMRQTISSTESGTRETFPFDVAAAQRVYAAIAGPAAADLPGIEHIIFEPDGAMLRLPLALLITDPTSAQSHAARAATVGADPFDFTSIAWLGRQAEISTAVSARSFRDVRALAPSSASRRYLGLGQNAPRVAAMPAARSAASGQDTVIGLDCSWPIEAWSQPISARELRTAQSLIGGRAELMTDAAFTDSAVKARDDLDDFRVLHFATHGVVTPPRPDCPARPALLTSFGESGSDGFLSFREIFDLELDADLVILSACDTASAAGLAASREAGISGGDSAMDGLVRAFFGAGSRSVIASHWPAPDDFSATERLITGLFASSQGTSVAEAMRDAQRQLMDDPSTSHPYYWAGFAIIGDGAQPVVRAE